MENNIGLKELQEIIIQKETPSLQDIKQFAELIESRDIVYNNHYQFKQLFITFCKWIKKINPAYT